jgi:DnaJ like chaperone protein
MGWIGKIVGGAVGFALGGPLGAIAGVALGHGFDATRDAMTRGGRGTAGGFTGFGGQIFGESPLRHAQLTFFVGSFSMLAKLAAADGNVTQAEVRTIEEFMNRDLRLDPQSKRVATDIFNTALSSPETFESFADQFYQEFANQPQLLELMIDVLYRVSAADGTISSSEENLIRRAADIFNFGASRLDNIKKRYSRSDDTYYAVLGCSRSDSDETIKKAYKSLVREYHPDTIASKGLPEEFTEFANKKFREIREAYETIRKERGF